MHAYRYHRYFRLCRYLHHLQLVTFTPYSTFLKVHTIDIRAAL